MQGSEPGDGGSRPGSRTIWGEWDTRLPRCQVRTTTPEQVRPLEAVRMKSSQVP